MRCVRWNITLHSNALPLASRLSWVGGEKNKLENSKRMLEFFLYYHSTSIVSTLSQYQLVRSERSVGVKVKIIGDIAIASDDHSSI
ncbi:hypothetical protein EUGRSUZ_B03035 [Eucalyptus grandis]|uniref:Uncharacterized protein n=2 Tax=Eucalyptus grandis TaxID=71139 RepID=A0ACC3LV61_EUCGR|nr:hypothetical protein EUGRSUZ_B03035 [Eucalyptus grandis]